MYLIVPKYKRQKGQTIHFLIMFFDDFRKFLLSYLFLSKHLLDSLTKIVPKLQVLKKYGRNCIDRFVGKPNIVDGIFFHRFNYLFQVDFSQKLVIMLKDKDKRLWNIAHYISNIFRKTVPLSPLYDSDIFIVLILLPQIFLISIIIFKKFN